MILFDLICGQGHAFEGWFLSGEAFDEQREANAIACPHCGLTHVVKAPMAPHVARRIASRPEEGAGSDSAASASVAEARADGPVDGLRHGLEALRRRVEATCDYVGQRFPEEARRIHYGETEARSIFGEASSSEAKALADEGIAVTRIPWLPRRND
ncbi:MAG: DUF1178 family protein [Rhodospirillales bacterium]|nr:MAG: DUF1178 family protein [Rhodospirillales bacterium]